MKQDTIDRLSEAYRIEDVADKLGCTYHYIYRAIRAGQLPAYKIANSYRVTREDLEAWLNSRRVA